MPQVSHPGHWAVVQPCFPADPWGHQSPFVPGASSCCAVVLKHLPIPAGCTAQHSPAAGRRARGPHSRFTQSIRYRFWQCVTCSSSIIAEKHGMTVKSRHSRAAEPTLRPSPLTTPTRRARRGFGSLQPGRRHPGALGPPWEAPLRAQSRRAGPRRPEQPRPRSAVTAQQLPGGRAVAGRPGRRRAPTAARAPRGLHRHRGHREGQGERRLSPWQRRDVTSGAARRQPGSAVRRRQDVRQRGQVRAARPGLGGEGKVMVTVTVAVAVAACRASGRWRGPSGGGPAPSETRVSLPQL